MARVPVTLFTDFTDGQTIHASDYTREREIMRTAINDMDEKVGTVIPVSTQGILAKIKNSHVDVKEDFGAKGDGVTDDTSAIQSAIDYVYAKGGGEIYFPLASNNYLVTQPLLVKLPASDGGYDFPPIIFKGEGSRGSVINKTGAATQYSIDACMILVKGSSLNIDDAFSGVKFDNIKVLNSSTAATTYGVYGKNGSRIIANYSSFNVVRDFPTVDSHDRYAFYIQTGWAWSFRDCFFEGDYGFYNVSSSTSLLLENCFARTDKIGYRINGVYSTLINCYGDLCNGTMFDFQFAEVTCTALGGESPSSSLIMNAFNSKVVIDSAYFIQPTTDLGSIIVASGSKVSFRNLSIEMASVACGYLWKNGLTSDIKIDRLTLAGSGNKFKYSDTSNMWANGVSVQVSPDETISYPGVVPLLPFKTKYWDWYVQNPTLPMNNMFFGFQEPTKSSSGGNISDATPPSMVDGIYINSDFSARNVLGWVRYDQTGSSLYQGKNYYIPLDVVCTTAERPTWRYQGMKVYDTDLQKPIWWNGTAWKNENNVNPDSRGINVAVSGTVTSLAVTFATAEADAIYGVTVSPAWNTTYWITSKTTTGFTINFGTAPASASTLDWCIRR